MSIRNNQDRLGSKDMGETTPPVQTQTTTQTQSTGEETPPMSFTTPTELVDLPSKGKFYPEGHPLYNQETIEIRYMTAKDEDILTSKSLLKKGLAVDRFLQNVIVNRAIRIDELLIGDKNAIVVAARVTGYGSDYETKVTCPNCGTNSSYEFDLDAVGLIEADGELPEDVEATGGGTFLITVPKMNALVECRLLTGKDEKALEQLGKNRKKLNLPETSMTNQFKRFVVSVNGVKEPPYIASFIDNMPALDSRFLRKTYQKIVPNVDLNQEFACRECDFEQQMEVPFTSDFFWPG